MLTSFPPPFCSSLQQTRHSPGQLPHSHGALPAQRRQVRRLRRERGAGGRGAPQAGGARPKGLRPVPRQRRGNQDARPQGKKKFSATAISLKKIIFADPSLPEASACVQVLRAGRARQRDVWS